MLYFDNFWQAYTSATVLSQAYFTFAVVLIVIYRDFLCYGLSTTRL